MDYMDYNARKQGLTRETPVIPVPTMDDPMARAIRTYLDTGIAVEEAEMPDGMLAAFGARLKVVK